MSGQIKDVKIKVGYDFSEIEKGSKALVDQKGIAKDLTKAFDDTNNAAVAANSKLQDGARKSSTLMSSLNGHVKDFTSNLNIAGVNVGSTFDSLNSGIGSSVKGMGLLKVAFASTGIGALLLAIGSLIAYFTRTEEGSEKLERGMAGLGAAFGVVIGKAADLGKLLVDAFNSPKQAITNLGNFIKDFVAERIAILLGGIKGIGTAFMSLVKGDFADAAKQAGQAFLDINRGVNPLVIGAEKLGTAYKNIGKEALAAANSAMAFTAILQDIEDAQDNLSLSVARTRNQIQLLNIESRDLLTQSKNANLTEEERQRLLQAGVAKLREADALEAKITNDQIALQKQKVAALQKENDLKVANGELDQGNKTDALREALIELENLYSDSLERRAKIQSRMDGLENASANAKKNLGKSIIDDVNKNAALEENITLDKNSKIIMSEVDAAELKKQVNEGYAKDLTSLEESTLQYQLDQYDKDVAAAKEAAEKKKKIQQTLQDVFIRASSKVGNAIFDSNSILRDNELAALQTKHDAELKMAGDNKQQQAILNNKYLMEERKIKREQAIADKEQGMFNIFINTAVAATKAAPNPYLIAEALAFGAIEELAVASKPLPKYNTGTKSVPGQYKGYDEVHAMLAPEEMVIPVQTKRRYTPALDAIFDQKIPADLINSFVIDQKKFERIMVVQQPTTDPELKKELKGLRSDIKNKKEYHINIDKNGISTLAVSSNKKQEILNNYFIA